METAVIIKEIEKLSIADRMIIVENTIRGIREETVKEHSLAEAARALLADYRKDKELVAFTALDGEDFYEVK
jgi:hypothetical protein